MSLESQSSSSLLLRLQHQQITGVLQEGNHLLLVSVATLLARFVSVQWNSSSLLLLTGPRVEQRWLNLSLLYISEVKDLPLQIRDVFGWSSYLWGLSTTIMRLQRTRNQVLGVVHWFTIDDTYFLQGFLRVFVWESPFDCFWIWRWTIVWTVICSPSWNNGMLLLLLQSLIRANFLSCEIKLSASGLSLILSRTVFRLVPCALSMEQRPCAFFPLSTFVIISILMLKVIEIRISNVTNEGGSLVKLIDQIGRGIHIRVVEPTSRVSCLKGQMLISGLGFVIGLDGVSFCYSITWYLWYWRYLIEVTTNTLSFSVSMWTFHVLLLLSKLRITAFSLSFHFSDSWFLLFAILII